MSKSFYELSKELREAKDQLLREIGNQYGIYKLLDWLKDAIYPYEDGIFVAYAITRILLIIGISALAVITLMGLLFALGGIGG